MTASDLWKIKEKVYSDLEKNLALMDASEKQKEMIYRGSLEAIENFWLKSLIHMIDSKKLISDTKPDSIT
jgi:hypothetical protein